jgi:hypothetical protein
MKSKLSSPGDTLYCSATDVLNIVFASPQTPSRGQSQNKRDHSQCADESEAQAVDEENSIDMQVSEVLKDQGSDDMMFAWDKRSIKPLRPRTRGLTQTVSLPTGLLFTGQPITHNDRVGNMNVEGSEEDWSTLQFKSIS